MLLGISIYYSNNTEQFVFVNGEWVKKVWIGLNFNLYGEYVWTDGVTYYYSYNKTQYVLNPDKM